MPLHYIYHKQYVQYEEEWDSDNAILTSSTILAFRKFAQENEMD